MVTVAMQLKDAHSLEEKVCQTKTAYEKAERWEGGSCLGTHVRIKDVKIKKKKLNQPNVSPLSKQITNLPLKAGDDFLRLLQITIQN